MSATQRPAVHKPNGFLKLVRFAVVIAAGAGGWFGYERFVESQDAETAQAAEVAAQAMPTAPWPDDLTVAEVPPSGPMVVTMFDNAGVEQLRLEFDDDWGRLRLTGQPGELLEFGPDNVYVLAPDQTWVEADHPLYDDLRADMYTFAAPTMADYLPAEVWEYTQLVGDSPGAGTPGPTRVLTFRIDAATFATAEPAKATQWLAGTTLERTVGPIDLAVELDSAGQIVSVANGEGDEAGTIRYAPLGAPPTFGSPLATES